VSLKLVFSTLLTVLFFTEQSKAYGLKPESGCTQLIEYNFYTVCYSDAFAQAEWTYHLLTAKSIKGKQKRTNNFKSDFMAMPVLSPRAFKGSGYDRGHLVPAGDMKLNFQSMSETFYMTNMSPQKPGFNRGIWRSLEEGFRKAVLKFGDAFVVTAPLLTDELDWTKTGVAIPKFYYKVAYFPKAELMLAFLLPHQKSQGKRYRHYSTSVDQIEKLTGFDFFKGLPDDLEDSLEKIVY